MNCEKCNIELIKKKITKENVYDVIPFVDLESLPINKLPDKIKYRVLEGVLLNAYDYYKCPNCDFFILEKKVKK